jgi:isoaspartyl peptidase/L-asparaginase-like protein (Ntn-hydrolase superfamily)
MSVVVACGTWPFSRAAIERHIATAQPAGFCLADAVVAAVESVEVAPEHATVGAPGSAPNASGVHELDAAFVRARWEPPSSPSSPFSGEIGSVLALRGFDGAVRVAREVARSTPHTYIAGEGALDFALAAARRDPAIARLRNAAVDAAPAVSESGGGGVVVAAPSAHSDTLGIVAARVDADGGGEIVAAVSTSGLERKLPGRVGDSAILGSGCYARAGVGACVATGDGCVVALFPIAFVAVQAIAASRARTAQEVDAACAAAIAAFEADPNVRAMVAGKWASRPQVGAAGRHGVPLVALCAVSVVGGAPVAGGACCEAWRHEFVMAVSDGQSPPSVAMRAFTPES